MQIATKEAIAIGICVASALAAAAAIRMGWKMTEVLMYLAFVWFATGKWVSRLPRLWDKNFRELFAIARREGLRESKVSSMITFGGMLLFVAYFVVLCATW
jgi:hypothetical protein